MEALLKRTVPCPQCNGKKFIKGKGRCYRCGGGGYVAAPSTAHK